MKQGKQIAGMPPGKLLRAFDSLTGTWHRTLPAVPPAGCSFRTLAGIIHYHNFCIWHEEDQARRRDVTATIIAQKKRAIDTGNQLRNNAIERFDEVVLAFFGEGKRLPARAQQNSETAGSMVDRMSVLSLKIYHMAIETKRLSAGADHVARCRQKLAVLARQRIDLSRCFGELLRDIAAGKRYFTLYRQFKMYNDPALNPALYGRGK